MLKKVVILSMMLLSSQGYADDCQKIDSDTISDAIKTFKVGKAETLKIETYECRVGKGNNSTPYSTFHWIFSKNNQPIKKGIYFDKNKPDDSGIVGQNIELLDANTVFIDEMAERGGILNLLHWDKNKQLVAYKIDYMGDDDASMVVKSKGNNIIIYQHYYDFKKQKYRDSDNVLKLKILNNKLVVINPLALKKPPFERFVKIQ